MLAQPPRYAKLLEDTLVSADGHEVRIWNVADATCRTTWSSSEPFDAIATDQGRTILVGDASGTMWFVSI